MSTFAKSFPVELITKEVLNDNQWLKDLLHHWSPAGAPAQLNFEDEQKNVSNAKFTHEKPQHLRLAIRKKYVNFYRGGQSVARIDFDKKGTLQSEIHHKYVLGENAIGQKRLKISSSGVQDRITAKLNSYVGIADLRKWIGNANNHTDPEKKFVDEIVAHNPNVIDLEMGLPAYSPDPDKRRAPRMDAIALEPVGDRWRIVFWEAKVGAKQVKCKGDGAPSVVKQLKKYTDWLQYGDHLDLVVKAFKENCRILAEFHKLAKEINKNIAPLGAGIVAVASSDEPLLFIDESPRLLIDNRKRDASFIANGHLQKLHNLGIHVQMVNGDKPDDMKLDVLP